jgi:hypothetical protein
MKKIYFTILALSIYFVQLYGQNNVHAKNKNLPCINKEFNLYVHVGLDSLGQKLMTEDKIKELLSEANKAFEPICISFNYCKIDYARDYSFNRIKDEIEVDLLKSRFHKKRRLNLYIVGTIFEPNRNSYSSPKGITDETNGIIIIPKTGLGLIHELGSTFGLLHTFENSLEYEKVDGSNCKTSGDLLCDTPADPFDINKLYGLYLDTGKCKFQFPGTDKNGEYYKTEIGNYMTHYFCAHCFFTTSQYEIMADTYLKSDFKMW